MAKKYGIYTGTSDVEIREDGAVYVDGKLADTNAAVDGIETTSGSVVFGDNITTD